jgi:hypothetical protein
MIQQYHSSSASRCDSCASRIEAEAAIAGAKRERTANRIIQLWVAGLGAVVVGIGFAAAGVAELAVLGIVGGVILIGAAFLSNFLWGSP